MSGPKADAILARHGKKRKRKEKATGIVIEEEEQAEEEEEDAVVVAQTKSAGWKSLDGTVKEEPKENVAPVKKRGGLRTAAQLRADTIAERSPSPPPPPDQATVHRDASGRIVDIAQLEADARRREQEEEDKKRQRAEWTKGLTQRREREQQRQEEAVSKDVARYADDARMNKELAQEERWNDPAAEFVKVCCGKTKLIQTKRSKSRRPRYQGPYAPNRFGIAPGFRWDGVDRSSGFEKKYFNFRNAQARKAQADASWRAEDM